jgi:tight adherence protein C
MNPSILSFASLFSAVGAAVMAAFAWKQLRMRELQLAGGNAEQVSAWRSLASRLTALVRPNEKEREEIRAELLHAGRQAQAEIDRFLEERVASLVLGCLSGVGLLFVISGTFGFLMMLVALYVGMSLPRKLLARKAQERRDQISMHLPSAIDLLMTSIDAGLSINQAIARVARELERSSPDLSEELAMTSSEMEAGVALSEAMHRLSRRVDVDDMTGLCGVVAQAHELGAPLVETLNDYAEQSRRLRMAMLEERAGKLVIKLTMPLAAFLLPAALIAILGPAAIQLLEALKN